MPALKPPTSGAALVDENGNVGRIWRTWFQDLQKLLGNDPLPLKAYKVATVPDATSYEGHIIYLSDEAGGPTVAFSDGISWRRVQDRAVIS